ncbi:nuclear transport factor 2 family protein [Massilia aquatica]|uniref:Nuclear transport factor 2 family protein n=1 Tax=Massilia aquatica TaxID=2609000 RepID=A0ABX0MKX5_9BURK|nr:nuclear transport factor 2 family protein [Massilia aquatica]NHZ44927.1 nuclear transport factor 2 family protein [Massilia aquatica]
MRHLLSLILLALCLAGPAHATDQAAGGARAADVAAIQKVVDQFKAAIIARDGKTLAKLFLQDHDSWLSVADEAKWAKVKARNPQAPKVFPSSWKKFAEFIQDAKMPVEERFYNVRIDTNGAVASVWFDFDFLDDGKVTNRGSESWQMVRAEDGWKISSMLYSMGD